MDRATIRNLESEMEKLLAQLMQERRTVGHVRTTQGQVPPNSSVRPLQREDHTITSPGENPMRIGLKRRLSNQFHSAM